MNFEPKTEQELVNNRLLKKGEYDFEIMDAFDKTSKTSGKPMIEVKVRVVNAEGSGRIITDYLLAETPEKLRHAAASVGILAVYETGNISGRDLKGKRGKLKLGIEKDKKHTYPDKNVVLDYIAPSDTKTGGAIDFSAYTH